ncbi:unnamed protein product [Caenorhabditis sp. 36 PRJEB53466]|nr:unnamed protein product [Caenorhabditis sp. 36 PRJEB53466]
MNFNLVPSEINRKLEPQLEEVMAGIRGGKDPEPLIRDFVSKVHKEWIGKAEEYARKVEEQRRLDKNEFEEEKRQLEKEFRSEHQTQHQILAAFALHLLKIRELQRDHEKFRNVKGEALITAIGDYCSGLDNLLVRHEDVKLEDNEQNSEALKKLREKCVDVANAQNKEIQGVLNCQRNNLPIPSICSNRSEIELGIQRIMQILFDLQSIVIYLTPEHWEPVDVDKITTLKCELEEKTGNLLQVLGTAEAEHKQEMQRKLSFRPDPRALRA